MATTLSLASTFFAAKNAYSTGREENSLAKQNAVLADTQASEVQKQGVYAQNRYRQQLNQFLGRQRATIAANGVQDVGSPLRLQEDAAAAGESDIANIRTNAALQAWGYNVEASQSRLRGARAAKAGTVGALTTLGSGLSDYYGATADPQPKKKTILGGSGSKGKWSFNNGIFGP